MNGQRIHGVQIGLTLDAILFSTQTIEDEKDIETVKENVGKIAKDIRHILSKEYNRTELDDIAVEISYINYIDDTNIDEYVGIDIIE